MCWWLCTRSVCVIRSLKKSSTRYTLCTGSIQRHTTTYPSPLNVSIPSMNCSLRNNTRNRAIKEIDDIARRIKENKRTFNGYINSGEKVRRFGNMTSFGDVTHFEVLLTCIARPIFASTSPDFWILPNFIEFYRIFKSVFQSSINIKKQHG